MVAFGKSESGGAASVQPPCSGYGEDKKGCKDFFSLVRTDQCGLGNTTNPLGKGSAALATDNLNTGHLTAFSKDFTST